MSFLKRVQEIASEAAGAASEAASAATKTASDPATQERLSKQAREAVGLARRGVSTVVERIDPGTLAELIIKATALQEMTNNSLRTKGSPYRISEIMISASIPPGVSFSIIRIDDVHDERAATGVASTDLVGQVSAEGEAVIALDGTTLDEAQIAMVREAVAAELPDELKEP